MHSQSMSTRNKSNLTVKEAEKILADCSCMDTKSVDSESEKVLLRQALLLIASCSDYQILGICADTTDQGLLALKTYSDALGYEATDDLTPVEGSVYIKFNPKTGLCYLDSYSGKYRGVLVSCQSLQDESINGTYGHLPLDLFVSAK